MVAMMAGWANVVDDGIGTTMQDQVGVACGK